MSLEFQYKIFLNLKSQNSYKYSFYIICTDCHFHYCFGILSAKSFKDILCPILTSPLPASCGPSTTIAKILFRFYYLSSLIPMISLSVRRLHDISKSNWWYLLVQHFFFQLLSSFYFSQ